MTDFLGLMVSSLGLMVSSLIDSGAKNYRGLIHCGIFAVLVRSL